MNDKTLVKELRCLRMHLAPLLSPEKLNTLEEAERRLTNPGTVSTVSGVPSKDTKKAKKGNQGARVTKSSIYNKYFYK